MTTKKTWLITGASSGIGYGIALAALQAGHTVIATARNPTVAASNHPEFASLGGQWAELDVSLPSAQQTVSSIISAEESRQSQLNAEPDAASSKTHWVIINNAGTMTSGIVEDQSESQINATLQIYLYGAIRVWKASIPTLRANKRGTLITMGSVFGIAPFPETHLYSALKATLTSLSDSYASVLRPLGIRVIVMEPGLFRTSIAGNAATCDLPITPAYKARVDAWNHLVAACGDDPSLMPGDPVKLGQRVVDVVDDTGLGKGALASRTMDADVEGGLSAETGTEYDTLGALRLVLGMDAYTKGLEKLGHLRENYVAMREIAGSTDFDDVVAGRNASRAGGAPGEGEGWKDGD